MEFNIDFSNVSLLAMRDLHISVEEVKSVFANPNSIVKGYPDYNFLLGFSNKRKFVKIAYRISKNSNFEVDALQIDLPYEEDIKEYWCGE
jgi:hypothetical protein